MEKRGILRKKHGLGCSSSCCRAFFCLGHAKSLSLFLSPPPFSIPSYFARSIYSIYNTFTRYVILYYAQKRICIDIFTWNKRRSLCDIFNSSFILVCHLRIVLLNLIKSQSCGRVEIKPISNSSN